MKIEFDYNTTAEGDTLSMAIQTNGCLFADADVQRGCYEIIKNAALYLDVPTCTTILNYLNAIDLGEDAGRKERIEHYIDSKFMSIGLSRGGGYADGLGCDKIEDIIRDAISFGMNISKITD